jgi:hypothetical protein
MQAPYAILPLHSLAFCDHGFFSNYEMVVPFGMSSCKAAKIIWITSDRCFDDSNLIKADLKTPCKNFILSRVAAGRRVWGGAFFETD